ncbi:hypothetical protein SAMN04487996_108159 [Dyadobacter soli]|uniref:Outer membrane protein beta-barrel domain-containing protein n=1 Tax=Dyadobacter soli TaxID=659014 RepID=A0A1G7HHG6_9BACT|nr:hypothetical protein [Dyadobacter soli]SDE99766.1 hypothetical protein SAMN04487996_108159 [Dyadobacter soli]
MKKTLLLLLPGLMLLAGTAEAQFEKGTAHWGATISAEGTETHTKGNSTDYKNGNHSVSPSIQAGWLIKDNRMFGLRLTSTIGLSNSKIEGSGPLNHFADNTYSLRLSPFIRHYKTLNPKWALFLQTGVEGAYIWSVKEVDDFTEKNNGYEAGLYVFPGISYRISPRFALETDLQLLSLNVGYSNFEKSEGFNFNAGITSGIGSYFGVRAAWYLQKSN